MTSLAWVWAGLGSPRRLGAEARRALEPLPHLVGEEDSLAPEQPPPSQPASPSGGPQQCRPVFPPEGSPATPLRRELDGVALFAV